MSSQVLCRCARAKLFARRGEAVEAEALARQATELARPTDCLDVQADTLLYLAEVLQLVGAREQARAAADDAHELYVRKEHLVGGARARELRARLDFGLFRSSCRMTVETVAGKSYRRHQSEIDATSRNARARFDKLRR